MTCKKPNCKKLLTELCDFLDGELDDATVEEVKQHMGRCQDCRLLVDTTRKTIEIFCNSEPVPMPEDLRDRLHQALEHRLGGARP